MTLEEARTILDTVHRLRAAEARDSIADNASMVLTLLEQIERLLRGLDLPLNVDANPYIEG